MQKEVFLVQWVSGNNLTGTNDVNTYVWDNELGALVETCDSIMDHMDIFMASPTDKPFADVVRDLIKQQKYYEAINEFNFFKSNYASGEERVFAYVLRTKVHSKNVGVSRAHPMASANPNGYFFVADKCGASCRKCHEVNEYATPDNINGTYVCYRCRNFGT